MKFKTLLYFWLIALVATFTHAVYQAGDSVDRSGYFETEHDCTVNVRHEGNMLHLYFVDSNSKVLPPLYSRVVVQYKDYEAPNKPRIQSTLKLLPGSDVLVSQCLVAIPFSFQVIKYEGPRGPKAKTANKSNNSPRSNVKS